VLLDSKRLSCSVAERSSHDGVLDIRESNARLTDALADMDGTTGRPRNSRNGILRLYLPVVVLAGVATMVGFSLLSRVAQQGLIRLRIAFRAAC
jgi:hypothetical protein